MKELIYQPRISGRAQLSLREHLRCIVQEAGLDDRIPQSGFLSIMQYADLRLDSVTALFRCERQNAAVRARDERQQNTEGIRKDPSVRHYYRRINLSVIYAVMESYHRPSRLRVWAGL